MAKGFDISDYQRGLDVALLKAAGADFVILKLGYGTTVTDACFPAFYNAARRCGLAVGAYYYSLATTEAEAIRDAQRALSIAGGRELPLGIYMDVEERAQLALRDSELTAVVKAFCDTIRAAGYAPGAYGSAGNLWAKVGPAYLGEDVLVWAAYWAKNQPPMPCDLWQNTDQAHVSGYAGHLDGDEALSQRVKTLISAHTSGGTMEPESAEIDPEFSLTLPTLKHGDTGDAVKALQGELIAQGYHCGGKIVNMAEQADGIYGNMTLEAVRSFQRSRNLPDTGAADMATRAALLGVAEKT